VVEYLGVSYKQHMRNLTCRAGGLVCCSETRHTQLFGQAYQTRAYIRPDALGDMVAERSELKPDDCEYPDHT
jgi:hypothetical protein